MVLDTVSAAAGSALISAGIAAARDAFVNAIADLIAGEWGVGTLREFCTSSYGRIYDTEKNWLKWCFPVRIRSNNVVYETQVALGEREQGDLSSYLHPAIECLPQIDRFPYGDAYRRYLAANDGRALPVILHGPFVTHRESLVGIVTSDGRWAPVSLGQARGLVWGHPATDSELTEWRQRWAEEDLPPILETAILEILGELLPVAGEVSEPALPFPEDVGGIRNGETNGRKVAVLAAAAIAAFAFFA